MSKKSPEDLDKLFQQEPEQYPFPYNEASWTEMEKLLDKDDRRRFLWWWFFGIGALILIGSIFFFGKNETEVVDANVGFDKKEILGNEKQVEKTEDLNSVENDFLNQNSIPETKELEAVGFNKNQSNLSTKKSNSNSRFSQQDISKNKKEESNLGFNDLNFRKNEFVNTMLQDSVLRNSDSGNNENLLKKSDSEIDSTDIIASFVPNVFSNDSISKIASLAFFLLEEKEILKLPLPKSKDIEEPKEVKNNLLFGAFIATEKTGTNRNNLSKLNWKIGAQIEYRFFQRYSASVGVSYMRKEYGAGGNDYQPDNGAWLYDIAPTTVDASCDILEIPVNIGFFQKKNNENGFYSKLGLTSFVMLEEHYYYHYEDQLPGQIRYWGGYKENKHWFGIGEIYVGYQHVLDPVTFLQIEPFFQIPLTGVGNGKVKLWSLGVNLKVNFKTK